MKWYKMDCDAQENLDMKKLVEDWGWEWYGRYWAILGKIGMLVTEKHQAFALQTNNGQPFPLKLLSDDLSTTVERLSDFCNYLADNHLIDKKVWYTKSLIFAPKLRERADEYTKKLLTKSRHSPEQEVEVEVDKIKKKNAIPTDAEEVAKYLRELIDKNPSLSVDVVLESNKFFDHFSSNGWRVGGKAIMKDWRAAVRNWLRNRKDENGTNRSGSSKGYGGVRKNYQFDPSKYPTLQRPASK